MQPKGRKVIVILYSGSLSRWLQLGLTLALISKGGISIDLVVVLMRGLMSFVGKVLIQSQDRVLFHPYAQGAAMNFAAECHD